MNQHSLEEFCDLGQVSGDGAALVEAAAGRAGSATIGGGPWFWTLKRLLDVAGASLGMSVVGALALYLLVANPRRNPGPLFFAQTRMGRDGRPFTAYKFRTMLPAAPGGVARGPEDGVELDRITELGAWLRATRLDETPQFVNVLRGEMSLIGPRPDVYEHALIYASAFPAYRRRHAVRPGISGLAQVRMGYAEGLAMARRKACKDLAYIRRAGWRTEAAVLRRTFWVLRTGFGAK